MSDIKHYEPLWGSWYSTALLGEGSFGQVYKVRREEFGEIYESAVKIISIPHNESEIRQMRSEGLDFTSMREFLYAFVTDILSEISLMRQFRGHSHVVSLEDHQIIEKEDAIGWDILIRMELLTSLAHTIEQTHLSTAEVIKLGIHICRALELCVQRNTIHRDIKPENIFVSPYGDYKLGDFGIARQLERTSSGLSKKGTYTYMAPEVFRGEPYGPNVDIYSLGIVMYRLLNQNRTPFLPDFPQPIIPSHRDDALQKRMNGIPVPPLKSVSPELNSIVLKACAYNRQERFANPTDMRQTLEDLAKNQKGYGIPGTQPLSAAAPSPALPERSGTHVTSQAMARQTGPDLRHDTVSQIPAIPGQANLGPNPVPLNPAMPPQASPGHSPVSSAGPEPAPSALPPHNIRKKNRAKLIAILSSCAAVAIAAIIFLAAQTLPSVSPDDVNFIDDVSSIDNANSIDNINFISISAGYSHTMRIKNDNSLWGWGSNVYGHLGDGTQTNRVTPVKIMDDVIQVSAGTVYTMAIKKDGSLWAWGFNNAGRLGDGTETDRSTPVKIMDDVTQVSAGVYYTMAIKKDGSLWAWGGNGLGELGNGTKMGSSAPVKIMDDVAQVAAGESHTMAIKKDGSLWAWGINYDGKLGDGTKTDRSTPVKIMDDVARVAAGYYHSMAIKKDGSLWAWGNNVDGQLGDAAATGSSTPIKIMDDVMQVSARASHTMAVKKDGSLWAWGNNVDGQLGDGTKIDRSTPVKIMDDVTQVAAGVYHIMAIKKDGSLWAWGNNEYGLGDGTKTYSLTPMKIN